MEGYRKRSSWISSFITGTVGWVCFTVIGALLVGYAESPYPLLSCALTLAVVQVLFLRLAFFALALDRHLLIGAFWGLLSGVALISIAAPYWSFLQSSFKFWLFLGAYVGGPVGAFLSYFYIDDRKLEASGSRHLKRDEHWLEPFVFGAGAYISIFHPSTFDLSFYVFFVGAMMGVFAAGASHFSPDRWKESYGRVTAICLGAGCLLGALSGNLFLQFGDVFWADARVVGAMAASLTFWITFWRGRQLAREERR